MTAKAWGLKMPTPTGISHRMTKALLPNRSYSAPVGLPCAVGGFEDLDDYAIIDLLDALVRKDPPRIPLWPLRFRP